MSTPKDTNVPYEEMTPEQLLEKVFNLATTGEGYLSKFHHERKPFDIPKAREKILSSLTWKGEENASTRADKIAQESALATAQGKLWDAEKKAADLSEDLARERAAHEETRRQMATLGTLIAQQKTALQTIEKETRQYGEITDPASIATRTVEKLRSDRRMLTLIASAVFEMDEETAAVYRPDEIAQQAKTIVAFYQDKLEKERAAHKETAADRDHYKRGVANWLAKEKGEGHKCGGCHGCGDDSLINFNACVGSKWIAPKAIHAKVGSTPAPFNLKSQTWDRANEHATLRMLTARLQDVLLTSEENPLKLLEDLLRFTASPLSQEEDAERSTLLQKFLAHLSATLLSQHLKKGLSSAAFMRLLELEKRSVQSAAYVPQDIAIEITAMLNRAGYGQPGTPNTLHGMVDQITKEVFETRATLTSCTVLNPIPHGTSLTILARDVIMRLQAAIDPEEFIPSGWHWKALNRKLRLCMERTGARRLGALSGTPVELWGFGESAPPARTEGHDLAIEWNPNISSARELVSTLLRFGFMLMSWHAHRAEQENFEKEGARAALRLCDRESSYQGEDKESWLKGWDRAYHLLANTRVYLCAVCGWHGPATAGPRTACLECGYALDLQNRTLLEVARIIQTPAGSFRLVFPGDVPTVEFTPTTKTFTPGAALPPLSKAVVTTRETIGPERAKELLSPRATGALPPPGREHEIGMSAADIVRARQDRDLLTWTRETHQDVLDQIVAISMRRQGVGPIVNYDSSAPPTTEELKAITFAGGLPTPSPDLARGLLAEALGALMSDQTPEQSLDLQRRIKRHLTSRPIRPSDGGAVRVECLEARHLDCDGYKCHCDCHRKPKEETPSLRTVAEEIYGALREQQRDDSSELVDWMVTYLGTALYGAAPLDAPKVTVRPAPKRPDQVAARCSRCRAFVRLDRLASFQPTEGVILTTGTLTPAEVRMAPIHVCGPCLLAMGARLSSSLQVTVRMHLPLRSGQSAPRIMLNGDLAGAVRLRRGAKAPDVGARFLLVPLTMNTTDPPATSPPDEGPQHFSPGMVNNPTATTACGKEVASHLATHDHPDDVDCPACREAPAFKARQHELESFRAPMTDEERAEQGRLNCTLEGGGTLNSSDFRRLKLLNAKSGRERLEAEERARLKSHPGALPLIVDGAAAVAAAEGWKVGPPWRGINIQTRKAGDGFRFRVKGTATSPCQAWKEGERPYWTEERAHKAARLFIDGLIDRAFPRPAPKEEPPPIHYSRTPIPKEGAGPVEVTCGWKVPSWQATHDFPGEVTCRDCRKSQPYVDRYEDLATWPPTGEESPRTRDLKRRVQMELAPPAAPLPRQAEVQVTPFPDPGPLGIFELDSTKALARPPGTLTMDLPGGTLEVVIPIRTGEPNANGRIYSAAVLEAALVGGHRGISMGSAVAPADERFRLPPLGAQLQEEAGGVPLFLGLPPLPPPPMRTYLFGGDVALLPREPEAEITLQRYHVVRLTSAEADALARHPGTEDLFRDLKGEAAEPIHFLDWLLTPSTEDGGALAPCGERVQLLTRDRTKVTCQGCLSHMQPEIMHFAAEAPSSFLIKVGCGVDAPPYEVTTDRKAVTCKDCLATMPPDNSGQGGDDSRPSENGPHAEKGPARVGALSREGRDRVTARLEADRQHAEWAAEADRNRGAGSEDLATRIVQMAFKDAFDWRPMEETIQRVRGLLIHAHGVPSVLLRTTEGMTTMPYTTRACPCQGCGVSTPLLCVDCAIEKGPEHAHLCPNCRAAHDQYHGLLTPAQVAANEERKRAFVAQVKGPRDRKDAIPPRAPDLYGWEVGGEEEVRRAKAKGERPSTKVIAGILARRFAHILSDDKPVEVEGDTLIANVVIPDADLNLVVLSGFYGFQVVKRFPIHRAARELGIKLATHVHGVRVQEPDTIFVQHSTPFLSTPVADAVRDGFKGFKVRVERRAPAVAAADPWAGSDARLAARFEEVNQIPEGQDPPHHIKEPGRTCGGCGAPMKNSTEARCVDCRLAAVCDASAPIPRRRRGEGQATTPVVFAPMTDDPDANAAAKELTIRRLKGPQMGATPDPLPPGKRQWPWPPAPPIDRNKVPILCNQCATMHTKEAGCPPDEGKK